MNYKEYEKFEYLMEDGDTRFDALSQACSEIGNNKMVIQYGMGEHLFKSFTRGQVKVVGINGDYSPVINDPTYIEIFALINSLLLQDYKGDDRRVRDLSYCLEAINFEKEVEGVKIYSSWFGT